MAKNDDTAMHVERFKELRAQTMASTGLDANSPRLVFITSMRMNLEHAQAKILAGEYVPPADLAGLQSIIEEVSPMPPAEPFRVEIVHGVGIGKCQKCGFIHYDRSSASEPQSWDDLRAETVAEIKAEKAAALEQASRSPSPAVAEAPPVAAAKPAAPTPPASDGAPRTRSIHDGNNIVKQDAVNGEGSLCWVGGRPSSYPA